jgi:hypothetical protein
MSRDKSGRKERRVGGQQGNPYTGLKEARRAAYIGEKKAAEQRKTR